MNTLDASANFTISEDVNGPAIAAVVAVEMILAVTTNSFILVITLCHPKSLKQPSTIFLTSLIVCNLLIGLLFMPFTVVTAATGEWLIGQPIAVKEGFCQFVGFIFAFTIGLSVHLLAVISFDRFLYIVQPLFYKHYMNAKVAVLIVGAVSFVAALLDVTPFFGLGRYGYSSSVTSCLPIWVNQEVYVIYFSSVGAVVFLIIAVTSTITFCFTHNFIKKKRDKMLHYAYTDEEINTQKHVYMVRLRNLIGIFGTLLLVYIVTFSPFLLTSVIGFVTGFENVMATLYASALIFALLNPTASSIVQTYFRRDIREAIAGLCKPCKQYSCKNGEAGKVNTANSEHIRTCATPDV